MNTFNPQVNHDYHMKNAKKSLAFHPEVDFNVWRKTADERLRELIGEMPEKVPLNIQIEYTKETELFTEKRFVFSSEIYADIPCHLLIPKEGKGPYPVVICLQGHTTGMHISLGRIQYENDERAVKGGRDFAIQVIQQGYAALVIEQRCFGERRDEQPVHVHKCQQSSMAALLLGRTMIGERVWDVSRAIDALSEFPEIDDTKIGCMGNSGGGTITYYAACLDSRIHIAMPSCAVCTYKDSIGKIYHCTDNYIPRIYKYFEMGDLAGLIAPKPLIIIAGRKDEIFPIEAVKENFAIIKEIYKAAGAEEKCKLIIGNEGHRFYPNEAWPVFKQMVGW